MLRRAVKQIADSGIRGRVHFFRHINDRYEMCVVRFRVGEARKISLRVPGRKRERCPRVARLMRDRRRLQTLDQVQ